MDCVWNCSNGRWWAMVLWLALWAVPVVADPVHVDLSKVANTALQDDAAADNGSGGWSDEGPNDMFVYPPLEFGPVTRNGHRFLLPAPVTPLTPTVIMLRGQNRGQDKPASVTVPVPDATGRYVYLLLNAVGQVRGEPANDVAATCTVTYTDGQSQDIPLRDGIELRQWYTPQWWDNSGASAWPFFMGRNLYSMKWRQYIGVWAMQWSNPRPQQPIRSLTFTSAGKAAPVIWAVTLDDADYRSDEAALKSHFARPADVPEGFFDVKNEAEREAIFAAALKEDHIEGIRRVDVIAPDLLAVTVDGALGQIGAGVGQARISPLTQPATFTIRMVGQSSSIAPRQVGRHSFEVYLGNLRGFQGVTLYWHTFYLRLPQALDQGAEVQVTVHGIEAPARGSETIRWIDDAISTPAIKVNQVGYSSVARQRYAYLGWWAGDLGAVDYSGFKTFRVIDRTSGQVALEGPITPRKPADPLSGEDVYEMDLAALKPGLYHVLVPGLGRSDPFSVGGSALHELHYHTQRAFYHQRCGFALAEPFTDFQRPACHEHVYESGFVVGNKDYRPRPDEVVRSFRGGYHDAGDDDVFTYHLRATAQVLHAFARGGRRLQAEDLNLPESGNQLPDLLDEADWALRSYMELQQPDGGIPLGRGNDQDYIRNTYRGKARPAFGILPPRDTSSTEYAAVAALYGRIVRRWDPARAEQYIQSAQRALAWALPRPVDPQKNTEDRGAHLFRAWAAAELFEATGDAQYHDLYRQLHRQKHTLQVHWSMAGLTTLCNWTYLTSQRPEADATIQAELRARLIQAADQIVKRTDENPYRMGHDGRGLGWGNGNGGGHYGDPLLRAFWLTQDAKYLDAASLNADFLLGANPIGRTFITSVGARYPGQPQISPTLYRKPGKRGPTVPGITNYGLAGEQPPGFPEQWPMWRRVRDIGGGAEVSSEFTVTETLGNSAMLFAAFWDLEPGDSR